MILTALRKGSELSLREVNETDGFHSPAADGGMWFCADEDYQTAELIGNKLILHIAQAYQMIEGHEKHTLPEVKALDQKQILQEARCMCVVLTYDMPPIYPR